MMLKAGEFRKNHADDKRVVFAVNWGGTDYGDAEVHRGANGEFVCGSTLNGTGFSVTPELRKEILAHVEVNRLELERLLPA